MNILVINCGSSSVKFQVLDSSGRRLADGRRERIGDGAEREAALAEILARARPHGIAAVGHRVVHGGDRFHAAELIDDAVEAAIEACIPLAPLHNPANLAGVRAARRMLPDAAHVAVFDTAFHCRLPRRARTYALDSELAAAEGIRRYGFHGLSHAWVAENAARFLGCAPSQLRIVSCHLGSGASVCAIEFGHSVDTSMGMTPLEGLVMGTRCGDIDAGVVLELLRDGSRSVDEVETLLGRAGGLAGLSGTSGDMREIEARAAAGDDRARLAIAVFAYRVRKYIGAYAAAMGGVDVVALTGGIGENSASLRRRILQRLDFLGLVLDEARNDDARVSYDAPVAELSASHARVRVLVVAANEELMIARETAAIVAGRAEVSRPGSIPIAVSARHVHLDRQTLTALFGDGSELAEYKPLSQPGQFAAAQKVNLVGPRDRIDDVRVLGPLRARNQVEISRTDEFHLGVDAPVRRSGAVEGSAPITLEGPRGSVRLEQGLICAWRHIHMTPADAARYGVAAGDEVEVAISGGPRDLVFGDVLVRVSPDYVLEMHIDTDEANAAELGGRGDGELVYAPLGDRAAAEIRRRRIQRD